MKKRLKIRRISMKWKWCDAWIGAYFNVPGRSVYICPVPFVAIKVEYEWLPVESHRDYFD